VPAENFCAEKTILNYPNYKNARDGQTKKKKTNLKRISRFSHTDLVAIDDQVWH